MVNTTERSCQHPNIDTAVNERSDRFPTSSSELLGPSNVMEATRNFAQVHKQSLLTHRWRKFRNLSRDAKHPYTLHILYGANSTLKEDIMNSRWIRCMISILMDLRLALEPVIFSVITGCKKQEERTTIAVRGGTRGIHCDAVVVVSVAKQLRNGDA